MAGHGGIVFVHYNAPQSETMGVSQSGAYRPYSCPHCGERVNGSVLALTRNGLGEPHVEWLRCPHCHLGAVLNVNVISPTAPAGQTVEGLPTEVEIAYQEARNNAAIRSFTSCELMCRKILMHVAVDKGDSTGRTFAQYLDYLVSEGFVTPPMKPRVDAIRRNGNVSTHEIPSTDAARAIGTLTFTAQLLSLVYEMDYKMRIMYGDPTVAEED